MDRSGDRSHTASTVNYASPGQGTLHHLTMEKFIHSAGVKVLHVPYKGSAGAIIK